jgi:Transcriptional regulator containing PAS, AAA-type ATPase, and DNA-binding domains
MEEIKGWEQQDRPLLTSVEAKPANGSNELGQRAQVLKDLALALLNEVETLGDTNQTEAEDSIDFYDEVRRFEIELIRRALKKTGGHQMRAARLLNVKVTTLNSKIKRFNITPEAKIYNYPTVEANVEGLRRRA